VFFFAEYCNKLKFSAGLRLLAVGLASLLVAACGGGGGGGGSAPTVSRFVYAVNFSDDTVLSYTVNGGLLRLNGYANAGIMPDAIALHPSLKYAYVANWGSNTVSQFNISAGGMLTSMTTPAVPSGQYPVSLAVDPQGVFAFVLNAATIRAYTIDAKTGALTQTSCNAAGTDCNAGTAPASIVVDPSGSFVYVPTNQGEISEYQINRTSGALTLIGSVPAGHVPMAMAFNPQGNVAYVVNEADNTVWAYTLNTSTGALKELAIANTGNSPQAVAVDPLSPNQNFLYVTNNVDDTVSIFDTAPDGAPSPLGTVSTGNSPLSIVLDVAGKFAYVANSSDNTVSEYTINGGALTSPGIIRARNTPIALALGGGAAAVSYTPKFVYVTNGPADTVSQYVVNASGGLNALAGTAATGTILIQWRSIRPDNSLT
jgi:6-phosphogluconolactonase